MRNARSIFWLFVITVAAVAANLFLSWRVPGEHGRSRRTLLDPSFAPVSITMTRTNASETVLEKTDRWKLVRPYAGTVDAQVVLRLLDALSVTPVIDSQTDSELTKLGRARADFGLETPALRLSVSDGTDEISFSFGAMTPATNGLYVAVGGESSVFVVSSALRAAVDLGPDAFRERDIFPFESEFILDFDLRKAGESPLAFTRSGDGWRVGNETASASRVREFLSRLTEASALDFVWPVGTTNEETTVSEARLVGYGLDPGAALTVLLRCRDGVDRRMLIGADAGEGRSYALVHNGGAIVTVASALKAAVLEGTRSFVDARLFPFEASSVTAFTLTQGETSYVVARGREGFWRLDSPVAAPADPRVATVLLGRILALTPSDLAADGIKVTVTTNRAPCVVSAAALLGDARLEDLRSRQIMNLDATLAKRLVSTPGGRKPHPPVSVVYSREHKTWNVESETAADVAVDASAVERLLGALAPLRAERIVTLVASSSDLSRYGLEKPFHKLSIDQEKEGAVRRNIFIGAETTGGRYATVGSSEAIFVLAEKTVEALTAPLVKK